MNHLSRATLAAGRLHEGETDMAVPFTLVVMAVYGLWDVLCDAEEEERRLILPCMPGLYRALENGKRPL
jgi:hypothetical protein